MSTCIPDLKILLLVDARIKADFSSSSKSFFGITTTYTVKQKLGGNESKNLIYTCM